MARDDYDPREWGAECDRCILRKLRTGKPVGPEFNHGATVGLLGEAPGSDEVREGRPFVGASGLEAGRNLSDNGVWRNQVGWHNVVACQPPGNSLYGVLQQLRKINKARANDSLPPQPTPMECCRPRLVAEMARYPHILVLGATALHAATNVRKGILDTRGALFEGAPFGQDAKIMPTVHPAFVARAKRWRVVLRDDIGRAFRWFRDELRWVEPHIYYTPTAQQLRTFLGTGERYWISDVETDALECLTAKLRCVAISDGVFRDKP